MFSVEPIVTRGILNNNGVVIPAAGWLILSVEVAPVVTTRKHGGVVGLPLGYPEPKDLAKKFYIKVTFQMDGETYTAVKYVDRDVKVSQKDITIETIDDKPVVKIAFEENFDVEDGPVIGIEFEK